MKRDLQLEESNTNSQSGTHTIVPANDNRRRTLGAGRSFFPGDAVARIFRPSRSVMSSGRARTKGWRLVFEPRTKPFIEPLMGYTGTTDTLPQVELSFPTLESAIAYAERQGLAYVVQGRSGTARQSLDPAAAQAAETAYPSADLVLLRLGWSALQHQAYGGGANPRLETALREPEAVYAAPIEVVADPLLTFEEKRAVLKNWAWNEYLIDLGTAEGMPENRRPARLDEVERALLCLERPPAAAGQAALPARAAA